METDKKLRFNVKDLNKINTILELESQISLLKESVSYSFFEELDKNSKEIGKDLKYPEDVLLFCLSLARKCILEMKSGGDLFSETLERYRNNFKIFD